jgi:DNA helicase-2/ATP-dependent DNA helicase PcrA
MIMREKRNTTRNLSYEDIAVLYRTNAQSRAFEGELRKNNIPYRIYGGTSFYQRKEIKDTLAYFRLAVNPKDNEALLRALTFPSRGIGDTTMKKVTLCAIENNQSYLEVMRHPDDYPLEMSGPMKKKISAFATMIDEMAVQSEEMDAFRFAEMLLRQTGLTTALMMDRTTEGIDRAQNVQELLNAIREFVTQRANEGIDYTPITDFLSEVSLMTDQDDNQADTTDRVTLMTVHAAKGLEFPVVYIVGLEENLFPSQFCSAQQEIEEERRLFYVAITRAMQTCVVSYARQRFRNGQITFNSPSRFLNDIDRAYMQILKNNPQPSTTRWGANSTWGTPFRSSSYEQHTTTRTQAAQPQPSIPTRTTTNQVMPIESIYSAGERILHKVFGTGTVNRVYRDLVTENDKIEIAFDKVGTKTLLLSHAKLERL